MLSIFCCPSFFSYFFFFLPPLRTSPSHKAAQSKQLFPLTVTTCPFKPSSLMSRVAAASLWTRLGKISFQRCRATDVCPTVTAHVKGDAAATEEVVLPLRFYFFFARPSVDSFCWPFTRWAPEVNPAGFGKRSVCRARLTMSCAEPPFVGFSCIHILLGALRLLSLSGNNFK